MTSKATRYLIDLAERVAATAGETFLALVLASGVEVTGVVDLSLVKKAAISAVAAGLAVLKGALASRVGRRDSASLAPVVAPPLGG